EGRVPDPEAPLSATTEINLHLPALLPTDSCPDVHERLTLYKRLANRESSAALDELPEELMHRSGKLPDQARALVDTHRLRILSRPLGVSRIDASESVILIQFVPEPPIDPLRIIQFIQSRRDTWLAGPDRLRIETKTTDARERAQRIREIL